MLILEWKHFKWDSFQNLLLNKEQEEQEEIDLENVIGCIPNLNINKCCLQQYPKFRGSKTSFVRENREGNRFLMKLTFFSPF
jgi:hypothetical protein